MVKIIKKSKSLQKEYPRKVDKNIEKKSNRKHVLVGPEDVRKNAEGMLGKGLIRVKDSKEAMSDLKKRKVKENSKEAKSNVKKTKVKEDYKEAKSDVKKMKMKVDSKESKSDLKNRKVKETKSDLKKRKVKEDSKEAKSIVKKTTQSKVEKTDTKKLKIKKIAEADKSGSKLDVKSVPKKGIKKNDENVSFEHEEETQRSKVALSSKLEAGVFDEKQFESIVSLENIKKTSEALKKLVESEVAEKKRIFSDYRYFLDVSSFKIPNCPKRMVKLNLKHSLVDLNLDDVVLIVPDLQRGAKVDYEPTIQHYEDLLREFGITGLKIVPFNQLRNECNNFEAKRKFANTYDYFLCDGRVVGHAVGFCGKPFQKPRTVMHAVNLDEVQKYARNIENALRRTSYRQLRKGDMISIPVGSHRLTINQLAENTKFVIDQLKRIFPGSYANIRKMCMKIDIKGTSSLPLYVSLAGAPADTPNVIGPREQRMLKLKKQANDILSNFKLNKTGNFVKLNMGQVKRKQKIQGKRLVLLSKENNYIHNGNVPSPSSKKLKKKGKATLVLAQSKCSGNELECDEI